MSTPVTPPEAPAPKKKSWFRRHKILSALLALVLLVALGNALGGDEDTPAAASKTSSGTADGGGAGPSASSSGSTADGSAAEEEAAQEEADEEAEASAEAEKKAEAKAKKEAEKKAAAEKAASAAKIGDAIEAGDFTITVTGVEPGIPAVGPDGMGEVAQGQFVKVLVTVENTGDKAEMFFDSEQKLVDEQGREHSTSNASWLLDEASLWLTDINPGNTAQGALLYDIPKDAEPTTLRLSSGWFSEPVEVALD